MKRFVVGLMVVAVFIVGAMAGFIYSQQYHPVVARREASILATGLPVNVEVLKTSAVLERLEARSNGHVRYLACGEIETSQSARTGFETSDYIESFVQWVVDKDKSNIAIVRYEKQ